MTPKSPGFIIMLSNYGNTVYLSLNRVGLSWPCTVASRSRTGLGITRTDRTSGYIFPGETPDDGVKR